MCVIVVVAYVASPRYAVWAWSSAAQRGDLATYDSYISRRDLERSLETLFISRGGFNEDTLPLLMQASSLLTTPGALLPLIGAATSDTPALAASQAGYDSSGLRSAGFTSLARFETRFRHAVLLWRFDVPRGWQIVGVKMSASERATVD